MVDTSFRRNTSSRYAMCDINLSVVLSLAALRLFNILLAESKPSLLQININWLLGLLTYNLLHEGIRTTLSPRG